MKVELKVEVKAITAVKTVEVEWQYLVRDTDGEVLAQSVPQPKTLYPSEILAVSVEGVRPEIKLS